MIRTYLILTFLTQIIFLAGAILIPVYITPGYYYWTALLLLMFFMSGYALSQRLNKWEVTGLFKK
ncbi:MAG: hypothetical protein DRQ47_01895 [Gammaproteobacteria bacterium]|nr:MAG: hypothetical protein DRQ47_01895 [Gammaproteobacteria bacterium]